MKEIIIEITSEGQVHITTKGYSGKACIEESQFLKDLLGTETARHLTPAYYSNTACQTVKKHLPLCG